ncbi:23187_t:CDS:1, partial [Gigaspora rosea]
EIQKIYKDKYKFDKSIKDTKTAIDFWYTIKANLQKVSNVYIIIFGAYRYSTNFAGLSTLVTIPKENSKGLFDIKFTDN